MSLIKCKNINNRPDQKILHDMVEDTYTFQSYDSLIATKTSDGTVYLDSFFWDYSPTTGKYRNIFLGEKKSETLKKIKAGIYKVINLNEVNAYPPMKVS